MALICSEPIRPLMGGLGIRYLQLARELPRHGVDVVLIHPGNRAELPADLALVASHSYRGGSMRPLVSGCDAAVAQGALADVLLASAPDLPVAIDLVDPWLVENLSYLPELGHSAYERDLQSWRGQLSRGDFFLCACAEQRLYYLGLLTALGRIDPSLYATDPELETLIACVPSGVPEEVPPHRPYLPAGPARVLFGRLYDWFDPWTALQALELCARPQLRLVFFENPQRAQTPQKLLGEVRSWARRKGWLGERVEILPPYPADRRFDVLRDARVLLATHRQSLETSLSFRTRFLDALAVGCPIVSSAGGAMSRLLQEYQLGSVCAPDDATGLAEALLAAIDQPPAAERFARLAKELAPARNIAPLLRFCRNPARSPTRKPPDGETRGPLEQLAGQAWHRLRAQLAQLRDRILS